MAIEASHPGLSSTLSSEDPSNSIIMPASPSRTATLLTNLTNVASRVAAASSTFSSSTSAAAARRKSQPKAVRLVAVSKLKPASDILALYSSATPAQVHFGENYLQELLEKSRILPAAIKWHFIGGLQSNKCVALARDVRGLWAVESVDTEKKATLLDKGWAERINRRAIVDDDVEEKLRVFVQVNTSGEENKAGVEPRDAAKLCRYIREKCPRLHLQGLMTIGAIARSRATTPETENEDFVSLRQTREAVISELGLEGEEAEALELSMGMSSDFEGAIALGSDQVRVGTTIFGERPSKAEAKLMTS